MPGYIKAYRDIQDNWVWKEKPFSKGQAWFDIVFRCNHKCDKIPRDKGFVWVLRGQFILSNYKLSEAWGWSESSVRNFIKQLISDGMLKINSTSHYTLYEVTNYCVYQSQYLDGVELFSNAQKTHRVRTEYAQRAPNKNVKNDKEINKYIFIPPNLEEVKVYCQERNNNVDPEKWYNFYKSKGWMVGKNKMKDWKAAVITWEKEKKPQYAVQNKGNFNQRQRTDEEYDNMYDIGR